MRPTSALAIVLCAAVPLVQACAVKQPPPAADALKGVMPPTTTVPAEWKANGGAPGAVITDWVQTFGDPQLDTLVAEGLQNNLDLKAAAARVDVAAGLVVQARSLLFPYISAIGGVGVVGRDSTKDRSGIAGEVAWELDVWGRVRAQAASADASREATEADLVFARQSLAALVATLWYETIAAERARRTAEDASLVYEELLRLVRAKKDVGQIGDQDVALAAADLERSRHNERSFARSVQQVSRGLEVVVGRYPGAELSLAPELPPVPAAVPEGLPAELLERRPDLMAAERRVAAAFHLIQAAEAARLPRIALTAAGGRSTSDLLRLADVGAGFWRAGIDLIAPLFTGGALRAQVAIANAEQQAALALYAQAALRAFGEVETTLASEELLEQQQRYLEAVFAADTEALRLGRLRYDAGATDFLHVLQMQARQLTSQFQLIGIRNQRLTNRVALHLALGGGFTPPTP
jgi:NodT family efflux transporter outer membrane factor (OMF) lipoprotein